MNIVDAEWMFETVKELWPKQVQQQNGALLGAVQFSSLFDEFESIDEELKGLGIDSEDKLWMMHLINWYLYQIANSRLDSDGDTLKIKDISIGELRSNAERNLTSVMAQKELETGDDRTIRVLESFLESIS